MFAPARPATSFREFVEKIYRTNALTVLRHYIEEHRVLFDEVPNQRELIDKLWEHNNDLDMIQVICARYLGDHAAVRELEKRLARRDERPEPPSITGL